MRRPSTRLAILGAGPVGLEAAVAASKLGLSVKVYERGRLAEHVERWGFVRMFTPFAMNASALGRAVIRAEHPKHALPSDDAVLTGREYAASYLTPLSLTSVLDNNIVNDSQVIAVGRAGAIKSDEPGVRDGPFRILLRDGKGQESAAEADAVFDCTGTFGQPRYVGDGGVPAIGELAARASIASGVEDVLAGQRGKYAQKTVMVVGSGHTAATHVCALADLAAQQIETWVVWLARDPRSQPMHRIAGDPLRDRDKLAVRANTLATRGEGNVEFHAETVIDRIVSLGQDKGFQVAAKIAGRPRTWEVDRIIASVGYRPDNLLYRELQVNEDAQYECAAGPELPLTTEPGFYILGAKSAGRNSNFLIETGIQQAHAALKHLTGKPVPAK